MQINPRRLLLLETEKFLNIAVEASLASSDIIMSSLDDVQVKNYKGRADLVTKTDLESEKIIKAVSDTFAIPQIQ